MSGHGSRSREWSVAASDFNFDCLVATPPPTVAGDFDPSSDSLGGLQACARSPTSLGSPLDLPSGFPFLAACLESDDPASAPTQPEASVHPPGLSPPTCDCLQTLISVVDHLENSLDRSEPAAVDSILMCLKHAIPKTEGVLRCSRCLSQAEHASLFVIVCEKLTNLSGALVDCFLHRKQRLRSGSASSDSSACPAVQFGSYSGSSPSEWIRVAHVLVSLHLKSLRTLLDPWTQPALAGLKDKQRTRLLAAELKTQKLCIRLQDMD
ncbi:Short-chain dehydrogenase/reductase SDR [Macrophomina phaseolina MS6]|uniref:Short-chain dehydrogenase/reductase SDR n=1 Tax=Macrophomina phaseolina (strain MS6) TaxID=1126212 RepID=K2RNG8_MACPH|nr:Short-chain dehydrogenase/reductase SDR [Macrophomina phaseolina MS6]